MRHIGEHEANITGGYFGEDGGQNGGGVMLASIAARDSAVGEDKEGSDGVGEPLNLGRNILLDVLVLPDVASLGEPWRIEDANLEKRLSTLTRSKKSSLTTTPLWLVHS